MSVIVEKNRITGQLEVSKPKSGYYTYSEIEYFFQTGPSLLMDLLMDNNDIIVPIFENKKDTELFLNDSISKNMRATLLSYAKFSWIEVRELDNKNDDIKQVSELIPTREDVLVDAGKWCALDPTNKALLVGVRRFQCATYKQIYQEIFGKADNEQWDTQKKKVVRLWENFLNFAKDNGYEPEILKRLVKR